MLAAMDGPSPGLVFVYFACVNDKCGLFQRDAVVVAALFHVARACPYVVAFRLLFTLHVVPVWWPLITSCLPHHSASL